MRNIVARWKEAKEKAQGHYDRLGKLTAAVVRAIREECGQTVCGYAIWHSLGKTALGTDTTGEYAPHPYVGLHTSRNWACTLRVVEDYNEWAAGIDGAIIRHAAEGILTKVG